MITDICVGDRVTIITHDDLIELYGTNDISVINVPDGIIDHMLSFGTIEFIVTELRDRQPSQIIKDIFIYKNKEYSASECRVVSLAIDPEFSKTMRSSRKYEADLLIQRFMFNETMLKKIQPIEKIDLTFMEQSLEFNIDIL
jgi:hypothetical protein